MDQVRVGIIGFGRIGAEHARWLSEAQGIRAVAVADATPARQALARERGLDVYGTLDAILADQRLDALLVSTPTAMHYEHAMAALAGGKHVMVEKPMALDLEQSRKLAAEAARLCRVLGVFHNRRWDLDYLTLRAAVAGGMFGKLINVESRLGQFASCVGPAAPEYRPGWRNEAAFGGGGLFDWGSHFIDQAWRLLWPARPVRVFAQLRGNVWARDCDDFARVCIDFDSGCVAMVEINTTTSLPLPRWHLDGTAGSAQASASALFDTAVWAALRFTPVDGKQTSLPLAEPGLSRTQIWEQFGQAVRGKGPPAVSVESVLPTMALLDAARESSRRGIAVDVVSEMPAIG